MVDMSVVFQFYIPIHSIIFSHIGLLFTINRYAGMQNSLLFNFYLVNQVNFVLVTRVILFETDL